MYLYQVVYVHKTFTIVAVYELAGDDSVNLLDSAKYVSVVMLLPHTTYLT